MFIKKILISVLWLIWGFVSPFIRIHSDNNQNKMPKLNSEFYLCQGLFHKETLFEELIYILHKFIEFCISFFFFWLFIRNWKSRKTYEILGLLKWFPLLKQKKIENKTEKETDKKKSPKKYKNCCQLESDNFKIV